LQRQYRGHLHFLHFLHCRCPEIGRRHCSCSVIAALRANCRRRTVCPSSSLLLLSHSLRKYWSNLSHVKGDRATGVETSGGGCENLKEKEKERITSTWYARRLYMYTRACACAQSAPCLELLTSLPFTVLPKNPKTRGFARVCGSRAKRVGSIAPSFSSSRARDTFVSSRDHDPFETEFLPYKALSLR